MDSWFGTFLFLSTSRICGYILFHICTINKREIWFDTAEVQYPTWAWKTAHGFTGFNLNPRCLWPNVFTFSVLSVTQDKSANNRWVFTCSHKKTDPTKFLPLHQAAVVPCTVADVAKFAHTHTHTHTGTKGSVSVECNVGAGHNPPCFQSRFHGGSTHVQQTRSGIRQVSSGESTELLSPKGGLFDPCGLIHINTLAICWWAEICSILDQIYLVGSVCITLLFLVLFSLKNCLCSQGNGWIYNLKYAFCTSVNACRQQCMV